MPALPTPAEPGLPAACASQGRTAVITQSNYIPWKGYFDLIRQADVLILYDDTQYTRRDWRNRNQIKTPQGLHWLTIPVKVKGRYEQRVDETEISEPGWAETHWKSLTTHYRRAAHYSCYAARLQAVYEAAAHLPLLSQVNHLFITRICEWLAIQTPIRWASELGRVPGRNENLIHLCQSVAASDYISGPAAQDYIQPELFSAGGIRLHYMDYRGYPEYPQLFGEFVHGVSILDLLLNTGPEAPRYLNRSPSIDLTC